MPLRRRVWIVDDSAAESSHAARVLAPLYDVAVFADGASLIEELERARAHGTAPDVLVLDWEMPVMSGLDVIRFVRAQSTSTGAVRIAIVLVTVHREPAHIAEGLAAGANDFVAKPFDDVELRARVDALVRTRELLERAERAEELNRAVLLSTPDPLFAVDDAGCVSFVNDAALALLGIARADVIGQAVASVLPSVSLAAGTHKDVEIAGRIFSPTVRAFQGTRAPFTISLRDITDRHREELRRLDLYAVIAHDLRSPLQTLMLRAERVLRSGMHVLPASTVGDLRKIDECLRGLIAMIGDFLDLASLESGVHELRHDRIDIVSLLSSVTEDFLPLLDASRITWVNELASAGAVHVHGDEERLRRAVKNLVSNAVKFTPADGSVTTRVHIDRDADSAVDGERAVCVVIEDTGRGIAAGDVPTLFQRYRRVGDTRALVGSGLGLMIVRQTIEAHGGSVGVESELGRGSRFWFRLPLAPARHANGALTAAANTARTIASSVSSSSASSSSASSSSASSSASSGTSTARAAFVTGGK